MRAAVRGGLPVIDNYPLRPIAARERRPEQGGAFHAEDESHAENAEDAEPEPTGLPVRAPAW